MLGDENLVVLHGSLRSDGAEQTNAAHFLEHGGLVIEGRTGDQGSWVIILVDPLRNFGNSVTPLCLSEESLKAVGPFHLVFIPAEINDPTQEVYL